MNPMEAAKAWRAKYLDSQRKLLRVVEYLDTPGADLEGVARILSGKDDSREG